MQEVLARRESGSDSTVTSASLRLHKEEHFRGPLPPPEMLAQYDTVFPGCAERIVSMAESQMHHRQGLEQSVVHGGVFAERRGQIFAFIISGVAIAGGVWLLSIGKDAQGYVSIISTLAALAGVFVYGRRKQAEERKEKRRSDSQPKQISS